MLLREYYKLVFLIHHGFIYNLNWCLRVQALSLSWIYNAWIWYLLDITCIWYIFYYYY